MQLRFALLGIVFLIGVAGCQPQVVTVEVTPAGAPVSSGEERIVEVTRIVTEVVVQEVTRTVDEASATAVIEVTPVPLGSDARPVQLLFAPFTNTAVIAQRGQALADALTQVTGQSFAVGVLDSEAAVIDTMCSAPGDTIGFLSTAGYVAAEAQCGVQAGNVAVHTDQYPWQTGMIVVRRDSGIRELEDLAGKSWAVADTRNVPDYLYFRAQLEDAGIEPGEIVEVTGDSAAMLAVLNGDVDFATAEYVPPIMPYEERLWEYGEDPVEPTRHLGLPATRSPIGYVVVNGEPEFGGYRLRDARSRIFDVEPEIYDQTQVLALSAPIPNETVALGRDFPLGLARETLAALNALAASEACAESLCAGDFYGWSGMQPVEDGSFAPVRFVQATLGLTDEALLTLTE